MSPSARYCRTVDAPPAMSTFLSPAASFDLVKCWVGLLVHHHVDRETARSTLRPSDIDETHVTFTHACHIPPLRPVVHV